MWDPVFLTETTRLFSPFIQIYEATDWKNNSYMQQVIRTRIPAEVTSYLLVPFDLHVVLVLLPFGSGEAGGERGGARSVQDGGSGKLLPLPAALPLRQSRVQALFQGV